MSESGKKRPKSLAGKVWYFLWEDDSIWSWIVNIVLAFIIIKFMIYPGLGLMFGTEFPIVAVISGSMEHDGSFEQWWNSQEKWYAEKGITENEFLDYPLKNGFNKGDLIVLFGAKPPQIQRGDIIVFKSYTKEPIIHRIIEIEKNNQNDQYVFTTKGDHNTDMGMVDKDIAESQILGRAMLRIPFLGYVKVTFMWILNIIGIAD